MGGGAPTRIDPAEERAVALLGELATHKTDDPQPAEPMERLTARVIDLVVWLAIGMSWSILAFYVDVWFFDDPLGPSGPAGEPAGPIKRVDPVLAWLSFVGLLLTLVVYEVPATVSGGRHFAKRRVHLRVVGPDDRPPGAWRALLRLGVWLLPAIAGVALWGSTFGTGWGFLAIAIQAGALGIPGAMFFADDHRGLHDRLAGTRVLADR